MGKSLKSIILPFNLERMYSRIACFSKLLLLTNFTTNNCLVIFISHGTAMSWQLEYAAAHPNQSFIWLFEFPVKLLQFRIDFCFWHVSLPDIANTLHQIKMSSIFWGIYLKARFNVMDTWIFITEWKSLLRCQILYPQKNVLALTLMSMHK